MFIDGATFTTITTTHFTMQFVSVKTNSTCMPENSKGNAISSVQQRAMILQNKSNDHSPSGRATLHHMEKSHENLAPVLHSKNSTGIQAVETSWHLGF